MSFVPSVPRRGAKMRAGRVSLWTALPGRRAWCHRRHDRCPMVSGWGESGVRLEGRGIEPAGQGVSTGHLSASAATASWSLFTPMSRPFLIESMALPSLKIRVETVASAKPVAFA